MNASGHQFANALARQKLLVAAIAIFLSSGGVRILSWHDTRLEVGKVQTAVSADYQHVAQLIREGGFASFLSSSSPLADLNTLGHPPGYSIVIALVSAIFGGSGTAVQFVQIICDSLAAVMIFLIVAELLPFGAALAAGLLAAFSPQFAWNSVLLLPDSLAVLPILIAIYLLARAVRRPRLRMFMFAGALIGVSCWLRANAMLLSFFLAAIVPLVIAAEKRWRYSLAIVCGTLLLVMPLTLRNAIVFHRFIPLSLGAGQTLLEGIADYDSHGRFGIPNTDVGIMKQEAEQSHRPDYYGTLFNPDGVERERARLQRGFRVIRSNPFWFGGVMVRRAASMLRLERSRVVSRDPPISHQFANGDTQSPLWRETASDLFSSGVSSSNQTKVSYEGLTQRTVVIGDDSKYGEQLASRNVAVKKNLDYIFIVPIKMARGRSRISILDSNGKVCASTIVETVENTSAEDQPVNPIQLAFVSSSDERVRLTVANEASTPANPITKLGEGRLFELGPARFLWTRYPRFLVHGIQKIFLTAVMLPLALIGLGLAVIRKQSIVLVLLTVVPVYYFCVQSIVHTEYRYVLAVDYFLFAFAGLAISSAMNLIVSKTTKLMSRAS
jgi:Dolichyl-phosphate-mannose-protein mannosyltransferase